MQSTLAGKLDPHPQAAESQALHAHAVRAGLFAGIFPHSRGILNESHWLLQACGHRVAFGSGVGTGVWGTGVGAGVRMRTLIPSTIQSDTLYDVPLATSCLSAFLPGAPPFHVDENNPSANMR